MDNRCSGQRLTTDCLQLLSRPQVLILAAHNEKLGPIAEQCLLIETAAVAELICSLKTKRDGTCLRFQQTWNDH